MTKSQLKPCAFPLVHTIDSENVIITGGFGNRYLRGGIVWSAITKEVKENLPKGQLKFCSYSNSYQTGNNTFIALIEDKKYNVKLVEYNHSDKTTAVIKSF